MTKKLRPVELQVMFGAKADMTEFGVSVTKFLGSEPLLHNYLQLQHKPKHRLIRRRKQQQTLHLLKAHLRNKASPHSSDHKPDHILYRITNLGHDIIS